MPFRPIFKLEEITDTSVTINAYNPLGNFQRTIECVGDTKDKVLMRAFGEPTGVNLELIQDYLPELPADDREFLISGLTPEAFPS